MPLVMSTTVGKLAAALASAQAEMSPAKKNATNPHFRSTYADLASLHDASRAALGKHGLAVVQLPGRRDGRGAGQRRGRAFRARRARRRGGSPSPHR